MTDLLKPIDAARAAQLRDKGALLVDVREPGEYARSHIPMSHNLPLSRLEALAMPAAEAQPVVFFCASGNRTRVAASRLLAKADGRTAYVMAGGISAWRDAGLPVESGRTEAGALEGGRGLLSRWFGL